MDSDEIMPPQLPPIGAEVPLPPIGGEVTGAAAPPEMTFAVVNGQKIPLGGDEADLPPTEGFWSNPKTGERIMQSAITQDSRNAQPIHRDGTWEWHPPPGAKGGASTTILTSRIPYVPDVSVESALGTGLLAKGVIGAGMSAAPGIVSRTTASLKAANPIIKMEIATAVLEKLGLSPGKARAIAGIWAATSGKGAAATTAATAAEDVTATEAAAVRPPPSAGPPRLVKGGGSATLESALDQGLKDAMAQPTGPVRVTAPPAPGTTMTPGGMPSVRPNFSYQAPAPTAAAPAAAAPVAAPPVTAPVALAPVAAPPPAPVASAGLTAKEVEVFHQAKAAGLSDADTKSIIEESRAALGTPRVLSWKPGKGPSEADARRMSDLVGSRQAARNLKTTQDQIKTLRGSSLPALPHNVKIAIDAQLDTLKDPADIAAYIKAAPNKAVLHYLKFKLGIP
jgi:hypothetical protein